MTVDLGTRCGAAAPGGTGKSYRIVQFITRKLVGPDPAIVVAGLAADIPFYLTYPAWLIRQGRLRQAFKSQQWPAAPGWMITLHHLFTACRWSCWSPGSSGVRRQYPGT